MKKLLFSFLVLTCLNVHAQTEDPVLFQYGPHQVHRSEFERVFLKNNNKEQITDSAVKAYLELYINFKLKVSEAKEQKMDEDPVFLGELEGYRQQLAQPYMVDKEVTEQLIGEAYERMKTEVSARHILIKLSPYALPKDTLAAYKKAMDIYNRLQKGEIFDTLAVRYSDDESARYNFGNLGYFKAFDMVYSFEDAAYRLTPGVYSLPVRTQFGYHIINVLDKREARGNAKVAHLMLRLTEEATDEEVLRAKVKMDSIYAKIINGQATFEEMVSEYSEDYTSKASGGEMPLISSTTRAFPLEFRESVFALQQPGDISRPFKTAYGWHLLKLVQKIRVPEKNQVLDEIKEKISSSRDGRADVSRQSVIARIRKEYNFSENPGALDHFIAGTDTSLLKGQWSKQNQKDSATVLFTYADQSVTTGDFSRYIENNQVPRQDVEVEGVVRAMYSDYRDRKLWSYEESRLDEKYDQFRYLMEEYHDGMLLFSLSEKMVWNKAGEDTVGLKAFYEKNRDRYRWGQRVDVTVYECKNEALSKDVYKWVKKGIPDTTIARMAYEADPLSLAIKKGKYQKGENPVADAVKWKKGIYEVKNVQNKFNIVRVNEVLKERNKALNEARGAVTNDYQQYLDAEWIKSLRAKYPVVIHQEVVAQLFK